jgi:hypothetical protein
MADVPDNPISGSVKNIMESQSQFHDSQTGCHMTSHFGDGSDDLLADFLG